MKIYDHLLLPIRQENFISLVVEQLGTDKSLSLRDQSWHKILCYLVDSDLHYPSFEQALPIVWILEFWWRHMKFDSDVPVSREFEQSNSSCKGSWLEYYRNCNNEKQDSGFRFSFTNFLFCSLQLLSIDGVLCVDCLQIPPFWLLPRFMFCAD